MTDASLNGLNLSELMNLMHDIVRPDPVSMVPETIGWLILACWIAFSLVLVIFAWVIRWRKNRYRRQALSMLSDIENQSGDDGKIGLDVSRLVKRTALAVYPRREVASLTGEKWADFLNHSSAHDDVVVKGSGYIADAAYRQVDSAQLLVSARRWIEVHRA